MSDVDDEESETSDDIMDEPNLKLSSALLYVSAFMLQSDQNILAPHLSAVAKEFHMSDEQRDHKLGGQLALGLFLIGAPASLAIASLGDVWNRKALLVSILALGGVASLGTACASSFVELFWWRSLTGVSLGAALPVTFSLLGDLYPASRRAVASSRVGIAMSAGQGCGQVMSGLFASLWRRPFVVVGAAFIVLASVVVVFMVEPRRGAFDSIAPDGWDKKEKASTVARNARNAMRSLAATPTVWLIFIQGIPGCVRPAASTCAPWLASTVRIRSHGRSYRCFLTITYTRT